MDSWWKGRGVEVKAGLTGMRAVQLVGAPLRASGYIMRYWRFIGTRSHPEADERWRRLLLLLLLLLFLMLMECGGRPVMMG